MKNLIQYMLIGLVTFIIGCSDSDLWDDHYKGPNTKEDVVVSDVMLQLSTIEECSNFYNALLEYKLDTLLDNDFLFTVFAPVNDNFDISTYPEDERVRNLQMHILVGKYFSYDIEGRRSVMSGKYLNFEPKNEGGYIIDNRVDFVQNMYDFDSDNGIVHVVDSVLEYRQNSYEYLYENFESIRNYFEAQIDRRIDYRRSTPTKQLNEDGLRIYDTVWVETNNFLDEVVDLTNDQDEYTVIIPSGDVVDKAIQDNVVQYFGTIEQIPDYIYTSIFDKILRESVFKGVTLYNELSDVTSLLSVLGSEVEIDKSSIIPDDADVELSNGVVHTTTAIELDNSSFLNIKDIDLLEDVYDLETATIPYRASSDAIAWKATSYLIWQTKIPDHQDEYMEMDLVDFLATDYVVYYDSGSNWGSAKLEFAITSKHLDEYDSYNEQTGEYTKIINTVDYHLFRGGDDLGTISFGSFGDATLRITLVGDADPQEGYNDRDDKFRLKTIKFTPVDLIQ